MTDTCRRCHSPVEADDLRCSICAMARAATRAAVAREIARVLRCDGCGAAIAYNAEVGAPRCAFCAAVTRVEQPSDPLEVARRVLPFSVGPDEAARSLKRWLSSLGFFRPSDLGSTSTIEQLRPILWCGWLVGADALVSWTADSNAGAWQAAWAPHAGETPMRFEQLLIPASRGLGIAECSRLTPGYDMRALVDAKSAPGTAIVEQFDVQRSAARSIVVDAIQRTAASRLTREGHVPGTSFRNVHVSVLLRALRTERVALCAYVLAYRYKGKAYRAIVHGQDVRYTFGDAPYSAAKIVLFVVAALAAVGLLIALGIVAMSR